MSYVAPLRAAVLWLVEQQQLSAYRWNADSVASLTGYQRGRARAYLTQLTYDEVLHEDADGCYTSAWCYFAWLEEVPATRPGGNSQDYLEAQQLRVADYLQEREQRLALGRRLRDLRGDLEGKELAARAGLSRMSLWRIENGVGSVKPETIARLELVITTLRYEKKLAN